MTDIMPILSLIGDVDFRNEKPQVFGGFSCGSFFVVYRTLLSLETVFCSRESGLG